MSLHRSQHKWVIALFLPIFWSLFTGCGSNGKEEVRIGYDSQRDRLNAANTRAASEKDATARAMGSAFSSTASGYSSSSASVTGLSYQASSSTSNKATKASPSSSSSGGGSTFSNIAPLLMGGLLLASTKIISKNTFSNILPSKSKEKATPTQQTAPIILAPSTANPVHTNNATNAPSTDSGKSSQTAPPTMAAEIKKPVGNECHASHASKNETTPGLKEVLDFTDQRRKLGGTGI